jgi:hypothetical protein
VPIRVPHPKGVLSQTRLQHPLRVVKSNEGEFQSLARRSRYSIRPLKFECDCFLTQNALWGSGTARHLGPTPRGRLKFGRMLAGRSGPEPFGTVA